jgi:hypothetical protein
MLHSGRAACGGGGRCEEQRGVVQQSVRSLLHKRRALAIIAARCVRALTPVFPLTWLCVSSVRHDALMQLVSRARCGCKLVEVVSCSAVWVQLLPCAMHALEGCARGECKRQHTTPHPSLAARRPSTPSPSCGKLSRVLRTHAAPSLIHAQERYRRRAQARMCKAPYASLPSCHTEPHCVAACRSLRPSPSSEHK